MEFPMTKQMALYDNESEIRDLRKVCDNYYVLYGIMDDGQSYPMAEVFYCTNTKDQIRYSMPGDFFKFSSFRNTKGKKVVFIDLLKVWEPAQRQGIGSYVLSEFSELMRAEGFDAIGLNASPIVLRRWDMMANKNQKQAAAERALIQSFYLKNGFSFAVKGKNYMFKNL